MTVSGATTGPATNVTVNGLSAILYADATFARTNVALVDGTNTFTAIAQDAYGRVDTNISVSYLPASASFTYDLNGNLTSDGTRCFAYDDENQLTSVWVTNVWRSDFLYDGKLRRRIRTEFTWNGTTWVTNQIVRYVYDGNLVIQERDANNLPLVTYTRGWDQSGTLQGAGGIGGLLARTDNGQLITGQGTAHAYYHADGNGNVTCLINGNQVVVAHYLYDPYGNALSQSGVLAAENLYRYSSKEFHVNSGLVCFLYRFYDPSQQRWLDRDPVGEWGGINLYAYVGNSPIVFSDPLGLSFWGDFGNGLNNTVSAIGQSMGQGLYDLSHLQWSQGEYNRIANQMYSLATPENPAATPYVDAALGISGAATAVASYALSSEMLASQGYYNVANSVRCRASQPFLQNASSRWFSTMQTDTLLNGVRLANTDQGLFNLLTTFRYANPGGGEVVLNWVTRTIIHANPFF